MGRLETWCRNRQKPRKLDGAGEGGGKWNNKKRFVVGRLGLPSFLDTWSTCSRLALSEGPVSALYEPQVCPLGWGGTCLQSL